MVKYSDYVYFNTQIETYGRAILIPSGFVKFLFVVFCVVTPGTN